MSWQHNFTSELNTRALEGYQVHNFMTLPYHYPNPVGGSNPAQGATTTGNVAYVLFILKRTIEE